MEPGDGRLVGLHTGLPSIADIAPAERTVAPQLKWDPCALKSAPWLMFFANQENEHGLKCRTKMYQDVSRCIKSSQEHL